MAPNMVLQWGLRIVLHFFGISCKVKSCYFSKHWVRFIYSASFKHNASALQRQKPILKTLKRHSLKDNRRKKMHLFNLESHRDYLKKTRVKCKYKELKDTHNSADIHLNK